MAAVARPSVTPKQPPSTPLLNRTLSHNFANSVNSPSSSYRGDIDAEPIIYELAARHLSVGFAGENRPRHIHLFKPDDNRRVGDYRTSTPNRRKKPSDDDWCAGHELYRCHLPAVDLGLVEARLERVVCRLHELHLQLDQKPRKAVLVIPSLLPTPLVEVALKVLFAHYSQPGSIAVMPSPVLVCVASGMRCGLVVDVGWEETVVTAVGEYREVGQRRSVRGGKAVVRAMAELLQEEVAKQGKEGSSDDVSFEYAEEVTRRMGWCRARTAESSQPTGMIKLPYPPTTDHESPAHIHISFTRLANAAEFALFPSSSATASSAGMKSGGLASNDPDPSIDDAHTLTLPALTYHALLSLPLELRAMCATRIIVTGGMSNLPGLKGRLLQELSAMIDEKKWDPVQNYGSQASKMPRAKQNITQPSAPAAPPGGITISDLPPSQLPPVDFNCKVTRSVETEMQKGRPSSDQLNSNVLKGGAVRGVETLGTWAGASLVAGMRVKGVREVEREDFVRNGFVDV